MPPKTERIEMRMDPEIIERIDDWRGKQSDLPTRSEAVRRLIEDGLAASASSGIRLDRRDKLIVFMLSEVLKNQHTQMGAKASREIDLKRIDMIQEAIGGGHMWALDWEMHGILHDHMDDPQKLTTVVNVLDMWRFIEEDFERFSDAEKAEVAKGAGYRGENPIFDGFDGNHETEYMSIAQFMVEKLDRFHRFKGRGFNSHSASIGRYSRMLGTFNRVRDTLVGRKMTPAEMVSVLLAE